jgi:allophanate hydrolase subunit 2
MCVSHVYLQEHDAPDVTDIASKVAQAADAVEAAAANLQGMLGDASSAMAEAFGGLDGRVTGLKQQLLKGEKDIEAVMDEVSQHAAAWQEKYKVMADRIAVFLLTSFSCFHERAHFITRSVATGKS